MPAVHPERVDALFEFSTANGCRNAAEFGVEFHIEFDLEDLA
jgi:hypothetical protein